MVRVCDNIRSLNEAIDSFVERGQVRSPAPKKRKATQKLQAMSQAELVEFAKYVFSPEHKA